MVMQTLAAEVVVVMKHVVLKMLLEEDTVDLELLFLLLIVN